METFERTWTELKQACFDILSGTPGLTVNGIEIHMLVPSKNNENSEKELCITIKYDNR